jgi:enamine deaminase RidA (YjgF/YER057c/UK114 family)
MSRPYSIEKTPLLQFVCLPRGPLDEYFLSVSAGAEEGPADACRRLGECLEQIPNASIVKQDMFGLDGELDEVVKTCAPLFGRHEWPVTRVSAGGPAGNPFAGIHTCLISGTDVRTIRCGGRAIGATYEDDYAQYCVLADIRPDDPSRPRTEQARRTFELMEEALAGAKMKFTHVVRTWIYLDSILEWYADFNEVRAAFYEEAGVFDRFAPASTGVGSANPAHTAVVADALAVKAKSDRVMIRPVPSPLQCSALDYGSSFSRAVEIGTPDCRRLLVSGTASIDPSGRTVHVGDVDAQVELTMRVVEKILESRRMRWEDVTRAIAYFKRSEDMAAFTRWAARRGFPQLPLVVAESDICRGDLLFEIDVDAVRGRAESQRLAPPE